jgi:uncharacterized membrane protein HdeD (DUF308 family)
MNFNLYILLTAFILSLIVYYFANRYQWEKKITYHASFVIIGIIGVVFFTYMLVKDFSITYLFVNILLIMGIILKVLKIILIKKRKE